MVLLFVELGGVYCLQRRQTFEEHDEMMPLSHGTRVCYRMSDLGVCVASTMAKSETKCADSEVLANNSEKTRAKEPVCNEQSLRPDTKETLHRR